MYSQLLKFRYYEKAKNFEKTLTKQLFLLSSVKTNGRFFQIFVAFSEKLDSKNQLKVKTLLTVQFVSIAKLLHFLVEKPNFKAKLHSSSKKSNCWYEAQ